MKYFIVLSFVFSSVLQSVNAQYSSVNKSGLSFGLKAGLNVSNMNFNKGYQAPATKIESSWKTGFVFGFLMDVPVYNKFSIRPEYLYSQQHGENKRIAESYAMTYISLPVLIQYQPIEKIALMAGPQFDLLLKAKQSREGKTIVSTHDTEERSFSAVFGIDFNFTRSLSLNARYIHGLNHIGIGQRSAVEEFKYEMVQVSSAFRF